MCIRDSLNIESISTRIIKNKFNLLIRLLHNNTIGDIIMKMLQTRSSNNSFLTDIQNISEQLKINFIDIIVSRRSPQVINHYEPVEEAMHQILMDVYIIGTNQNHADNSSILWRNELSDKFNILFFFLLFLQPILLQF